MNKFTSMMVGLTLVAALQVSGQEEGVKQTGDRGKPPRGRQEALTPDQVAKVKEILSKYDPKALTAEMARSIHSAFREAGLRGGPAMHDAIVAAGFDPEKLRELAPPPRHERNRPRQDAKQETEAPGQPGQE